VKGHIITLCLISFFILPTLICEAQTPRETLHHSNNKENLAINSKLEKVEGRVQGKALNLTWFGGKEAGMKEVREPAVSGMFSPDKPDILSRDVKKYLENAKKEKIDGEVIALVSPHAGYMYSGQVAAHAYKLIEGKPLDSVGVVSPSHRLL